MRRSIKAIFILFIIFLFGGGSFVFGYLASESNQRYALAHPDLYQETSMAARRLNQDKLLELTNDYRLSQNLSKLSYDTKLCILARSRLVQIQSDWSHRGFDEDTEAQVSMYRYRRLGENLASDQISEESTVQNWINSPSHKENIVGDYTHSCVQTFGDDAVQIFAKY